jgi:hypothetical protein
VSLNCAIVFLLVFPILNFVLAGVPLAHAAIQGLLVGWGVLAGIAALAEMVTPEHFMSWRAWMMEGNPPFNAQVGATFDRLLLAGDGQITQHRYRRVRLFGLALLVLPCWWNVSAGGSCTEQAFADWVPSKCRLATADNRRRPGGRGHPGEFRAPATTTCQDGQMGRVARFLVVSLSAVLLGVVFLVVALYVVARVDPHAIFSSCSTSSVGSPQKCTPLISGGAWPWLPVLSGLLGAAAGGFGVDSLIRHRRTPSDSAPNSRPAFG